MEGRRAGAAWPAAARFLSGASLAGSVARVCAKSDGASLAERRRARRFLEDQFVPWRLANPDGALDGLVTGYYEPVLPAARTKVAPFMYPLDGPPV